MATLSIQIPENAVPVSFDEAMDKFETGQKVLATLSEGDSVFAAHAFAKEWDNLERNREFREFERKGKWYLI